MKYVSKLFPPQWVHITPEIANEYLKHNTRNYRLLNHAKVQTYVEELLSGNWKRNGESIIFDKNGILLDGQHRLTACVKSNVPFDAVVVFDADNTNIVDVGMARTITQIMRASDLRGGALVASIANIVINGGILTKSTPKQTVLNYIQENNNELLTAANIVSGRDCTAKKAPCATIGYCMIKTGKMTENEVRQFFKVVNTGNSAETEMEPSSALVLRRQLSKMHGGGIENQTKQLEITFKAMNDFHFQAIRKKDYTGCSGYAKELIKSIDTKLQLIEKAG